MNQQKINKVNPNFKEIIYRVGRPKKFKSNKHLQDAIYSYFESCCKNDEWPTVTGLCNHLDIERQTLLNYSKKEEFFDTIKRAKEILQESLERQLVNGVNVAGTIFNLINNYGWQNKTVVDNTHEVKGEVALFEIPKNGKEDC